MNNLLGLLILNSKSKKTVSTSTKEIVNNNHQTLAFSYQNTIKLDWFNLLKRQVRVRKEERQINPISSHHKVKLPLDQWRLPTNRDQEQEAKGKEASQLRAEDWRWQRTPLQRRCEVAIFRQQLLLLNCWVLEEDIDTWWLLATERPRVLLRINHTTTWLPMHKTKALHGLRCSRIANHQSLLSCEQEKLLRINIIVKGDLLSEKLIKLAGLHSNLNVTLVAFDIRTHVTILMKSQWEIMKTLTRWEKF